MSAHPSLQSNQQHQDQQSDTLFLNAGLAERHKVSSFIKRITIASLNFVKCLNLQNLYVVEYGKEHGYNTL